MRENGLNAQRRGKFIPTADSKHSLDVCENILNRGFYFMPGTAVENRKPLGGLVFHSDRGVQYCARLFRVILRERRPGVRQSMSGKGNCWGNACAESFFKTLKRELETLDGKHSEAEVRQSVFMYIEAYYNRVRIHSALDYVAPNVFYLGKVA
jgi:transposase InsO family protein